MLLWLSLCHGPLDVFYINQTIFFLTIGRAIIGMEHVTTWALLVAENGVLKRASSGYLRQAGMAIMPQGFFSNIVYYNVVFLSSCLELAFSVCFASA